MLKMPHNNKITILKEVKIRTEATIIIVTSKERISDKIKRKTKRKLVLVLTISSNLANKIGTIEVGRTTIVKITIITVAVVVASCKAAIMIVKTISWNSMNSSSLTMTWSAKDRKEEDVEEAVAARVKTTKTTEEVNSVTKIVMAAETSKDRVTALKLSSNNTDLKTRMMEGQRLVRVNTMAMTTKILRQLTIKNRMLNN
jgi:hypothetical protein